MDEQPGRERWWRAAAPAGSRDADASDAEGLRAAALAGFPRVRRHLTVAAGLPPDREGPATISHRALRVSAEQTADLLADCSSARPGTPAPPDTGRVVLPWPARPRG